MTCPRTDAAAVWLAIFGICLGAWALALLNLWAAVHS